MANDINDLRGHLFKTIEQLRDKENPMDIERAKAVSELAQVVINAAKVEVDLIKITGGKDSAFFKASVSPAPQALGNNTSASLGVSPDNSSAPQANSESSDSRMRTTRITENLPPGIKGITRHALK